MTPFVTSDPATGASLTHGSEITRLRTDTERLLLLLHRGGNFAHLWTDAGNRSFWFSINNPTDTTCTRAMATQKQRPEQLLQTPRHVPKQWLRHNVYFSVHPLSEIPPQNTTGLTDPRYISSQTGYICAINTLFAEFDGKDFVYARDYQEAMPAKLYHLPQAEQQQAVKTAQEKTFYQQPDLYKARALRQIGTLPYPPNVIIDSGGGYHCYWLLRHTVPIDDSNRDELQIVQHEWVNFVGGDRGAADLRRVLRLPGTYNHKPGFNSPQRVVFLKSDFGQLYDYRELEEAVNDWSYEQKQLRKRFRHRYWRRRQSQLTAKAQAQLDEQSLLRQQFNAQHSIEDLLLCHGYQRTSVGHGPIRLARPGRDCLHSSITIFEADREGRPERSIHFSTNDPLYSQEYVDRENGKIRRVLHDAFYIYVMLEHNGDWAAAYRAAAAEQQVNQVETAR